jgi:endonuclease V-like protein UPF0215 family
MAPRISHVIGFDDGPFAPDHRGDVLVVGAVFAAFRLDGVLCGKIRRDGANATRTLVRMVSGSRFGSQLQLILLQGIAFAGFNVVDLPELHRALGLPVVTVARRGPDLAAIQRALLTRVPGGRRKWRLIECGGPMESLAGVYVQRVGIGLDETCEVIERLALNSRLPEPLRVAHLIAGALACGESRHRA